MLVKVSGFKVLGSRAQGFRKPGPSTTCDYDFLIHVLETPKSLNP